VPTSASTTLILVRHGETAWNAQQRLQGSTDVPLSEDGQRAVKRLRLVVHALKPDTVVTSDLLRARTTAAILGFNAAHIDRRWREANFGTWTGKLKEALEQASGGEYKAWREGQYTPPSAESWELLCSRVGAAIDSLCRKQGSHLVITHAGPIRATLALLVGLSPMNLAPVSPASATIIDFSPNPRMRAYNLTAHDLRPDPIA
jgi:broad specificity phosphatase PhoE